MYKICTKRKNLVQKALVFCVLLIFTLGQVFTILPPEAYAQTVLNLPSPGMMINPTPGFVPAMMSGIKIDSQNPFHLDFIIDTGHSQLKDDEVKDESTKLIKYFLTALTVPEDDLWVNLSPYEKDRIVPDKFGATAMGRDLLAQDYLLKQLTASLMYPEKELGAEFWKRVYEKINARYGKTDIPVNTFNKVWVLPEKAVVYESGNVAFIVESRLKVMLEQDYLALRESQTAQADVQENETREMQSKIMREIVIPEIEKEVNEGGSFALLRQVYHSMVLATWFKRNLKESVLGRVYAEKNKVDGIDIEDKDVKEKIYQQYLEAFKVGVFDYIKEDYDPVTKDYIPRRYFSGGMQFGKNVAGTTSVQVVGAEKIREASEKAEGSLLTVSTALEPVKNLDRLRRIINILAKKENQSGISENAAEDEILDFILNYLGIEGQEIDGEEGVLKFVIPDSEKESRLGQAIQKWVISPRGGVKAINYQGKDGVWKIVAFESEMDRQIDLELAEVEARKKGDHWIVAHNKARQKLRAGDQQIDQEGAQQEYEVARRDIISASVGSDAAMISNINGNRGFGPANTDDHYTRKSEFKETFLDVLHTKERLIAPGREDFDRFSNLYGVVNRVLRRLLTAKGLNPDGYRLYLVDTVQPNAAVVKDYPVVLVNIGLLKLLADANGSEDALAFVLAHEITHIQQMRDEIDFGKEEDVSLGELYVKQRGNEYHADLLAISLMEKAGYTVREAPTFFGLLGNWMQQRKMRDFGWGSHPEIEERVRKMQQLINDYHWDSYVMKAQQIDDLSKRETNNRTQTREFQERVINARDINELLSLFEDAHTIDELQFAFLVGFEMANLSDKEGALRIAEDAFNRRMEDFIDNNSAKRVIYEYIRDEILVMIRRREDYGRLDVFKAQASSLDNEVLFAVLEVGIPPLFAASIDVDSLTETDRHKEAKSLIQHLYTTITRMDGKPSMPSDRFNMYATGFVEAFVGRLLAQIKDGSLSLEDARRLLKDLQYLKTEIKAGVPGWSKRIDTNIYEVVGAILRSESYANQLTVEDVDLLIGLYTEAAGLGGSYGTQFKAEEGVEELYRLALKANSQVKEHIRAWALNGKNASTLKNAFISHDVEDFLKIGSSFLAEGQAREYLDMLLASDYILFHHNGVFKEFLDGISRNLSDVQVVEFHRDILIKFRERKINQNAGIYEYLRRRTRTEDGFFQGDLFDAELERAIPEGFRSFLSGVKREHKYILYIFSLGGTLSASDLRWFLFGGIKVRDRDERMMENSEIVQMILESSVHPAIEKSMDNPNDSEERYNSISSDRRSEITNRWFDIQDETNPERTIYNVELSEFELFVKFFNEVRNELGERLAKEDADTEQQEIAYGQYLMPLYLQEIFHRFGHETRLSEDDVRYSRNAWRAFAGEISSDSMFDSFKKAQEAGKRRPQAVNRVASEDYTIEELNDLFSFLERLPDSYEQSVEILTQSLPSGVFRNYALYMLFVNRILIKQAGVALTSEEKVDLSLLQSRIAALDVETRQGVLDALSKITSFLTHDKMVEDANKKTAGLYFGKKKFGKEEIDENAVRDEHQNEQQQYDDLFFTTPGHALAQLQVFVGDLAESELSNIISDSQVELSSKRALILKFFPKSSVERDRWLKEALESISGRENVEEIESILSLFENRSLRDSLALRVIDQHRDENPELYQDLDSALEQIQRFFPEKSPLRDDILNETAQFHAHDPEKMAKVQELITDPFQKVDSLTNKEEAKIAFGQDAFHGWIKGRTAQEKSEFLLWLLGMTDDKPFFVINFEHAFHLSIDSLRDSFLSNPSKYYPEAGISTQREFLEPFLYGEQGIFTNEGASQRFLESFFDGLIPVGSSQRNILKTIFDTTFLKADQIRKEEIFLSLVWSLTKQQQEEQDEESKISQDEQQARTERLFMESLGLGGRKLAQVLSRSNSVDDVRRKEYAKVQDNARKLNKGVVFDLIKKIYGSFEEKFTAVLEPKGNASISVVYKAVLKDGRVVALKIKRPEIDKRAREDLQFLRVVIEAIRPMLEADGVAIPRNLLDQIEESVEEELDFKIEANNTQRLYRNVTQRSVVRKAADFLATRIFRRVVDRPSGKYQLSVPEVIETANNTLIIQEWVNGETLASLKESGEDVSDYERAAAIELLRQVFVDGFYHGDPHLGNIMFDAENGKLYFIDAGASFSIDLNNRIILTRLFRAIDNRNLSGLQKIILKFGGEMTSELEGRLNEKIINSEESVANRATWFFQVLEDAQVEVPEDLLNIFRFLGTGGVLFEKKSDLDQALLVTVTEEDAAVLEEEARTAVDEAVVVNYFDNPDAFNREQGDAEEEVGGIDLNPNLLELETQGEGMDFDIPIDPQVIQTIQIDGFSPVILQISPTNLPFLMGASEGEGQGRLNLARE